MFIATNLLIFFFFLLSCAQVCGIKDNIIAKAKRIARRLDNGEDPKQLFTELAPHEENNIVVAVCQNLCVFVLSIIQ